MNRPDLDTKTMQSYITLNNIQDNIPTEFKVDRETLDINFDYFENKLSATSITLDLDLDSTAVDYCYNFVFDLKSIEPIESLDYDTTILVLEVYNVLGCKNAPFLQQIVNSLLNRLDFDEDNVVQVFCEMLKANSRVCTSLSDNMYKRLAYKFNPQFYAENENGDPNKVTLVILPSNKWKCDHTTICTNSSFKVACSNWGLLINKTVPTRDDGEKNSDSSSDSGSTTNDQNEEDVESPPSSSNILNEFAVEGSNNDFAEMLQQGLQDPETMTTLENLMKYCFGGNADDLTGILGNALKGDVETMMQQVLGSQGGGGIMDMMGKCMQGLLQGEDVQNLDSILNANKNTNTTPPTTTSPPTTTQPPPTTPPPTTPPPTTPTTESPTTIESDLISTAYNSSCLTIISTIPNIQELNCENISCKLKPQGKDNFLVEIETTNMNTPFGINFPSIKIEELTGLSTKNDNTSLIRDSQPPSDGGYNYTYTNESLGSNNTIYVITFNTN